MVSHTEKKNLASWKLFQDYLPLYTDLVNMAKFPLLGEDQLVLLDTVKTGSTTNLLYATANLSIIFFEAQSSAHYKQLVSSTPKGSRNIYEL